MKSGGLKIINKEKAVSSIRYLLFMFFLFIPNFTYADTCTNSVTSSNSEHISNGRAYACGLMNYYACASGDGEDLGVNQGFMEGSATLIQAGDGTWYTSDQGDCASAEGSSEGSAEGSSEGSAEGSSEGSAEGSSEGSAEGSSEGSAEGSSEGSAEGSSEGSAEGSSEGSAEGSSEGSAEGSSEGSAEGSSEGSAEGSSEGSAEGSSEGSAEGSGSGGTYSITLTVEPDTNGNLNGNFDSDLDDAVFSEINSLTIDSGLSETFQVNAASGYIIQEVVSGDTTNCPLSVHSGGTNAIRTYTISNVNASCTITARFLISTTAPGAWRGATSMIMGGVSSFDAKEVRPNIILQMDDSFIMNSEVQYSSTSGQIEFEDLNRIREFFVNRRVIVRTDGNTGYIEAPPYTESPTSGYGFFALGTKGTDSNYNTLAYNEAVTYEPWPGYTSRDLALCNYISPTSGGSSETSNNENYCPKFYPQYDNSLAGNEAGCKGLNSSILNLSTIANADYCAPRDCNKNGCREIVPIDPDKKYWRIGLPWDADVNSCSYLYTGPTASSSDKSKCVPEDLFDEIWGGSCGGMMQASCGDAGTDVDYDATAYTGLGAGVGPFGCWVNNLAGGTCAYTIDGSGGGSDYGDAYVYNGTYSVTWRGSAFDFVCQNFFSQEWVWPCEGQYIAFQTESVTNIIPAQEILNHYYTDSAGNIKFVRDLNAASRNNYANWFTYYRTRGHVQKAAMLRFVEASTEERIGLSSNQWISYDPTSSRINSSSTSGNILNPTSMAIAANKTTLKAAIAKASQPFVTNSNTLENLIVNGTDKSSKYFKDNEAYQYKDFSDPSNLDEDDTTKNCRQNNVVVFTSSRWSDNSFPSTATSAAGSGGKATTYASLSNVANNYYDLDMFSQLDDYVPVTGTYSTNTGQHVKLWIAYMGPKGSNDETSQYLNPSYVNPAPGLTTYDAFIDDMAQAAVTGKGGFYRAMTLCDAVNLFSFPGANNDMLDWINANNQADYEACQAGSNDSAPAVRGMRISWKELKRH